MPARPLAPLLPLRSPAVERGVGFFETAMLVDGRAMHWSRHLARFRASLSAFDLPQPSPSDIARAAAEAIASTPISGEAALRITWLAIDADLDAPSSWRLDAVVRKIPDLTLARRRDARAITLPATFRRDMPEVKATSYFSSALGLRHAMRAGCNEGLFVDGSGAYLEGTSTSLAAWIDGVPHVARGPVLPSVTLAASLGAHAPSIALTRDHLREGAMLLGSLTMVAPLRAIDGVACEVPDAMLAFARELDARMMRDLEDVSVPLEHEAPPP